MSETWTISVGGRVYGPYTLEQMQAFHAEGRLATHSLVARAGEEQFHPASEDPELAPLFPAGSNRQPEQAEQPPSRAKPRPSRAAAPFRPRSRTERDGERSRIS